VIPKDIRREVGLTSRQVLHVIARGGTVIMVPDQPIGRMRGYLKGMSVRSLREKRMPRSRRRP
jgi:bifunctional DNA-binding transcriptional regulator/antitoxin component of YhaV-PrlF toxin-antitoxin module